MVMLIQSTQITNLKPKINFKAGYAYALCFTKSQNNNFHDYIKVGSTRDFMQRLSSLVDEINFRDDDFQNNIEWFIVSDWVSDCEKLEKEIQHELSDYLVKNNLTDSLEKHWPFKNNRYTNEVFYADLFSTAHKKLTQEHIFDIFAEHETAYKTE